MFVVDSRAARMWVDLRNRDSWKMQLELRMYKTVVEYDVWNQTYVLYTIHNYPEQTN
jgi:hypothetical protein